MTFSNHLLFPSSVCTRFGKNVNKTTINFRNKPLIDHILDKLDVLGIKNISIIYNKENKSFFSKYKNRSQLIKGGDERSESVKNALLKNIFDKKFTIIHDLARPIINEETIFSIKKNLEIGYDCAIPYSKATDTIILDNNIIPRDNLKLLKTPQGFKTKVIKEFTY